MEKTDIKDAEKLIGKCKFWCSEPLFKACCPVLISDRSIYILHVKDMPTITIFVFIQPICILCFVTTVLSISNEFWYFGEKIANLRLGRKIGDASATFRTSIVQVAAKFRKLSCRPDENSSPKNENSFRLNDNLPALNEISFRLYLAKVRWR